jgi:hypothetical protein
MYCRHKSAVANLMQSYSPSLYYVKHLSYRKLFRANVKHFLYDETFWENDNVRSSDYTKPIENKVNSLDNFSCRSSDTKFNRNSLNSLGYEIFRGRTDSGCHSLYALFAKAELSSFRTRPFSCGRYSPFTCSRLYIKSGVAKLRGAKINYTDLNIFSFIRNIGKLLQSQ